MFDVPLKEYPVALHSPMFIGWLAAAVCSFSCFIDKVNKKASLHFSLDLK